MVNFIGSEKMFTGAASGNVVIPNVTGLLEAVIISNDETTPNVARTVQITARLADGSNLVLGGPLAIGAGTGIYHPRKQALAIDLTTVIAGIYERYVLAGPVTIAVASANAGDKTRVRIVTEM